MTIEFLTDFCNAKVKDMNGKTVKGYNMEDYKNGFVRIDLDVEEKFTENELQKVRNKVEFIFTDLVELMAFCYIEIKPKPIKRMGPAL